MKLKDLPAQLQNVTDAAKALLPDFQTLLDNLNISEKLKKISVSELIGLGEIDVDPDNITEVFDLLSEKFNTEKEKAVSLLEEAIEKVS
jgi:hypothetical protein